MSRPRELKSIPYTWQGPPRTVNPAAIARERSAVDLPVPPVPKMARLPVPVGVEDGG